MNSEMWAASVGGYALGFTLGMVFIILIAKSRGG